MDTIKEAYAIQIRNCIDAIKDCENLLCVVTYNEIRSILLTVRSAYYNLLRSYYIDIGLSSKQARAIISNIHFIFNVVRPYYKNGGVFSTKDTYNQMMAWHIYNQGKDGFGE